MKKRLICLAVSLLMALQMLGGWPAAAAEEADRTAAENSFATDLFCVETTAGGAIYRLEHWDPNGANGLCIWTGVVSAASPSNGGWKLKPASDGHYYLLTAANALTASGETAAATETYAAGNDAQLWDLVPIASGDGFDCKIVSVKYGAELAYAAGAAAGTLVCLAPAGEGAVWAVQNLSKSEQTGTQAFLTAGPSEEGADRVAASNNFASDVFTLETADGSYQTEHYMGDGSASLWGAYSSASNMGNGGWTLTPVKGGHYRITTSGGDGALAAASEQEVVYNASPDAADPAQQWDLVPDETTKDPFDCKIVNVAHDTQLAYGGAPANDVVLGLSAEGQSWIIRNLKQTELLGFLALVAPGPAEYVDWGELTGVEVDPENGTVAPDAGFDGPQIEKVRVINEGSFLEIYWDRYVDEVQAVNVDNFVLRNGSQVIELERKGSDYTNTLYFDKNNREIAATDANCMARLPDDLHMSSIGYIGEIGEIGPEGLTLEVKGAAIKDESGRPAKQASYSGVPKVNYYTQFLTSKTGIVIKADDTVDPATLTAAAAQVDIELSRTETGIAANMAKYNCSLAIYSPQQNAYFIPEHRGGFRTSMYDVEGYGGSIHNNCVSSIAERNVLRTKGNPNAVLNTAYPDENILIHEFGHCIKSVGIELLEDQTLANELFDAYVNAKESGLWPNTYRISNSDEYFATMCAVWFNVMDEVDNWNDGTRCPLNTREELKKYDPVTYAFFEKILPTDTYLPAPWDEFSPDRYHDEYVDPAPLANQVEAVDSDFEKDLIMIEASFRGERKLIEKYAPDETRPEENLCLWWKYSEDPADTTQNWVYKIVRTAEGYYRFLAGTEEGESVSLTATSSSTVAAAGHAPDAADTAQQWKFVEDTATASEFDGRLVSVKYGTELAFERPFQDGSIVVLNPAGSGDRWFVRNVTQSAAVEKEAYLKPAAAAPDKPDQPSVPVYPSYPGGSGSGTGSGTGTATKPGDSKDPKPSVETTVLPDGGSMVVETSADGTKVTTVKQADGTTALVTETPAGSVTAQVSVSETAKTPVALAIPALPVAQSLSAAAVVTITVPGTEAVRVEIPVETDAPGTVAFLVSAAGEEVVKTSLAGSGVLAVTIPGGGAEIRIVDNSKSFADTAGHWSANAVAFVTARSLFRGVSETAFQPDEPMTRGMLATVLARYDGQDTSGGSVWYEKGMAWAAEKGISDGSQPERALSRQELAVMLYRYAGQPAASGSLEAFPDSSSAASWAEQALRWAVSGGLLQGNDAGELNPQGPATRGEVAAMLMRFVTLMAK